MNKTAIYLRTSTAHQSTDMQRADIMAYCKQRGIDNVEVYEDAGFSGRKAKRPGLIKLKSDCAQGKVSTVICWKLDRMFRSLVDMLTLLQDFKQQNVNFIAIKNEIDMSSASGRLMTSMLGAFAEFEAELARERIMGGLAVARSKGVKLGRKASVNVTAVRKLRGEGKSFRTIATELKISLGSVSAALKISA